jgi:hypothetical protein
MFAAMLRVAVAAMTGLTYLHEPAMPFSTRRRLLTSLPYTYAGEAGIAIKSYRYASITQVNRTDCADTRTNDGTSSQLYKMRLAACSVAATTIVTVATGTAVAVCAS